MRMQRTRIFLQFVFSTSLLLFPSFHLAVAQTETFSECMAEYDDPPEGCDYSYNIQYETDPGTYYNWYAFGSCSNVPGKWVYVGGCYDPNGATSNSQSPNGGAYGSGAQAGGSGGAGGDSGNSGGTGGSASSTGGMPAADPGTGLAGGAGPGDSPSPTDPQGGQCGSVIQIDTRNVGETLRIVGTPFRLVYSTSHVQGRLSDYHLTVPVTSATPRSTLSQVSLTLQFVGRNVTQTYTTITPNISYVFTWDGLDSSGNLLPGSVPVTATVNSVYSDGSTDYPPISVLNVGAWKVSTLGLGDWGIDAVHFFDIASGRLYFGNGTSQLEVPQALAGGGYWIASPDGSEVYNFDSNGRHLSTQYGITGAIKYTMAYDSSGRLSSITDGFGNQTVVNRGLAGQVTSIQAPFGQQTQIGLNANGLISSIQNPNLETYLITYNDAKGLIATYQKPNGQVSSFSYDSGGLLTGDSNSAGNSWTFLDSVSYGTSTINMTSATGLTDNYVVTSTPTTINRSSTLASGYTDTFTSTTGNVQSLGITTGAPQTLLYEDTVDARFGRMAPLLTYYSDSRSGGVSLVASASQSVTYNHPSVPAIFDIATMVTTTVQNSKTTTSSYNASLKKFTVKSPVGRYSYLTIDNYQRPVSTQLATLDPVSYTYDSNGRLHQATQNTRVTTLAYNSSGWLSSITDALGEAVSYTYDGAGRVLQKTLPDLRVVTFTYDGNGNVTSVTPPGKSAQSFTSNLFDLTSAFDPPALSGTSTNTTYTYNNDKKLTQITRPDTSTVSFTYDPTTGLLNQVTMPTGNYLYNYNASVLSTAYSPDDISDALSYTGPTLTSDMLYNLSGSSSYGGETLVLNNDLLLSSETVQGFLTSNTSGH